MDDTKGTATSYAMPGHLIRRLHQVSTSVFLTRVRAAGFDLTPVQFATLDALRDGLGRDQASLARAIAKDRATVGAVLHRLESKGLVRRVASARDRRAREIALTKAGMDVLETLRPVVDALQREILPGLTEGEYRRFVVLATKAAEAAGSLGDG